MGGGIRNGASREPAVPGRERFGGKAARAEPFLGEVSQHGAGPGGLWMRAGSSEAFLGEIRVEMGKIRAEPRGGVGRWRLQM